MVCEDDEIAILADKPCFAHTMYCPRNLGIKSDDWENIGMEAKVEMKLQSFTYIVPTDDVYYEQLHQLLYKKSNKEKELAVNMIKLLFSYPCDNC